MKFVAFDSFYSHHFEIKLEDTNNSNFGGIVPDYTTFEGINETHMQDNIKEEVYDCDENKKRRSGVSSNKMHLNENNKYSPFLKHLNA